MTTSHEPGTTIAEFSLPASTGATLGLAAFKGKMPLVLVFLDLGSEEDLALLAECNARLREFGESRSQILVVARITAREARQTSEDMDLSIPILADASGAMARDYDAADNGTSRRMAVVADKEGRLVRRFDPLPLDGEATDVADALLYAVRAVGSGSLDG